MSKLKPCPHCGSVAVLCSTAGIRSPWGTVQLDAFGMTVICSKCGATILSAMTEVEAVEKWNTRHAETCHYIPDVMHSYYDEDDNEIDTDEADPDGCHCSCDHCGYTMMTGELGWFDESPGEHGGIVYVPRFKHCPECGRRVER